MWWWQVSQVNVVVAGQSVRSMWWWQVSQVIVVVAGQSGQCGCGRSVRSMWWWWQVNQVYVVVVAGQSGQCGGGGRSIRSMWWWQVNEVNVVVALTSIRSMWWWWQVNEVNVVVAGHSGQCGGGTHVNQVNAVVHVNQVKGTLWPTLTRYESFRHNYVYSTHGSLAPIPTRSSSEGTISSKQSSKLCFEETYYCISLKWC